MARSRQNDLRDVHKPEYPKGLYRRGDSFRYRRMVHGKKSCDVWGIMPEQDAIDRAIQYAAELRQGKDPIKSHAASTTTFHEFAYEVWLKQKLAVLRPTAWTKYRSVVDNFDYFLTHHRRLSDCRLKDIDYGIARDFITMRQTARIMPNGSRKFTRAMRNGAAKKTVYADRLILSQLFNEAVKRGLSPENPFKEVTVPKVTDYEIRQRHRPLTPEEAKVLLTAAKRIDTGHAKGGNARLADIIEFMVYTGMREGEVVMLEWSDVDWNHDLVKVRQKMVTEVRILPIPESALEDVEELIGKRSADQPVFRDLDHVRSTCRRIGLRPTPGLLGLKVRDIDLPGRHIRLTRQEEWRPKASQGDVPMCGKVKDLLTRLRAASPDSQFVFQHHDGGHCRLKLLDLVKEAQRAAEIPGNLRVHDMRHTCAVWLRRQGVPLETIMGILRHADIRETQIYAPYDPAEGRKAIRELDRI